MDARGHIAILVESLMYQRLLESAVLHLNLTPHITTFTSAQELVEHYELVLAENDIAHQAIDALSALGRSGDPYRPAVLLVTPAETFASDPPADGFDGVLPLPQSPATLAASLSVALYAHRSFERRYEDALNELEINRGIFHSVTSGVSVADARQPDLPLVYVNPAFEAISGYPLEDVIGKNCRFLQGEHREQPSLEIIRDAIRDHKKATAVIRNYRKDGTAFWNELSLSPILNREGQLTHFVGIQNDVSARVEFEIALRESEKLAAVGRLSSTIAHEINNPLEAVTNLVYLARHTEDRTEIQGYLDTADQELRRVKLITEQSLRFNRQSSRPEAVLIPDLLSSVLDILHSRFDNANIVVERHFEQHLTVVCMASEIRQVLNNLIGNSIDSMKHTGGRLCIRSHRARNTRSGTEGVALLVADTGTGIAPDIRPDIFKAFFTTKNDTGNGLGLWICDEIVRRHHGRLTLRSRTAAPSGTVFRLFLPFQAIAGER